mmetsp:Transcript_55715/g.144883  ORF Transcript_55715/g.144883 Transcript_55715/m.144883 type:complete len:136 (-) Transcript_55715:33-440(-)
MSSRCSMPQLLVTALSAVGVAGLLYYLLRPDEDEESSCRSDSGTGKGGRVKHQVEQLDLDVLDDEDRRLLAEVSKKGYYHGRPKSDPAAPPPSRIDVSGQGRAAASSGQSRAEFDDFQKKWDRFGDEKFIDELQQ